MDYNGYYYLTQDKIDKYCEPVYETEGADSFNLCQAAASTSDNESLVKAYAKKLMKGYDKDFKTFVAERDKTKQDLLEAGKSLGTSFLHNLFGTNPATTSTTASDYQSAQDIEADAEAKKKKSQRNWIIGISALVVVTVVGIVIYKKTR